MAAAQVEPRVTSTLALKTLNFELFSTGNCVLGTHVTRAGLGDCGNTSHPIAGQQMARLALALALCCGAAHGLGGTTNPVCSDVRLSSRGNCENKLAGESCFYSRDEDDRVFGVCLLSLVDIGVMKCSCCRDGGEGLAPEDMGVEPGTVLPAC